MNATKNAHQIDMLSGPLLGKICLFALPLAASSILQQLFNAADVAVVGRFASSKALAAVGANSSAINLMVNLFVGLSVGANVVIATLIGKGEQRKINDAVHTVISIALASGAFLVVLGQLAARAILTAMRTPDDVIDLAVLYLKLYFLGMPFIMLYNFGSAILRSKGDSKRPLYSLTIAGIVNVLLNLLLVIVFRMGVAGVAIATVISNVVSSSMIVFFLLTETGDFKLSPRHLCVKKEHLVRVIKIGAPAGLQGMVFSFSNVCIQTALNGFGADAIAGSAAALNYECFGYFIVSAFTQACVTFTSQNFGAHKFARCRQIFSQSFLSGIVLNMLLCGSFLLLRHPMVAVYTSEESVAGFAIMRMALILPFDWLMCTYEISGGALRGMGRSMTPAIITIFGTCVFRLAWVATVFTKLHTFTALMAVYPASWTICGISMTAAYFIIRRQLFTREAEN
ncbi:MAG: MATE family efflux transporter [Treponema sp.]|nr:MATE family efflux transporter [Treponema sp.]